VKPKSVKFLHGNKINMGIYLIDRDLNAKYSRLNKIDKKAGNAIKNFVNEIKIAGITKYMEYFYLVRLRVIYNYLHEKFLNPDKKTIIDMLLKFREKYSDKTLMDYEQVMKRFYKWKFERLPVS